MTTKGWQNIEFTNGSQKVIVILPINDIHEHFEPGFICPCRSKVKEGKGYWPVIIHNSFDGREKYEIKEC